MDGGDMESGSRMHDRLAGLYQLLRDAHGSATRSNGSEQISGHHPAKRGSRGLVRPSEFVRTRVGNAVDLVTAAADFHQLDERPVSRRCVSGIYQEDLGHHEAGALAYFSNSFETSRTNARCYIA